MTEKCDSSNATVQLINHVNHVKAALKKLGYESYHSDNHQQMFYDLVARKMPPEVIDITDAENIPLGPEFE